MTFTNTRNFESHVKSKHRQSVIYQCRLCDVTAKVSRSIGTHMRYCEGQVEPKSFRCIYCDFSSDFENGLKVHISIQHKSEHNKLLPTKKVFTWTDFELSEMALYEKSLISSGITGKRNINIQSKFHHRTIPSVAKYVNPNVIKTY